MAYDGGMARKPSLEDYDAGRSGVYWAERIAAHVQPAYDEPAAITGEPRTRRSAPGTKAESEGAAIEARKRYEAYRERQREVEAAYQVRAAEDEARKRAYRAEQRRLESEWLRENERRVAEIAERQRRFQEEQAAWEEAEGLAKVRARETMLANAMHIPQWGGDVLVVMAQSVPIRWNSHPETGHIIVPDGRTLRCSRQLANALLGRDLCWEL